MIKLLLIIIYLFFSTTCYATTFTVGNTGDLSPVESTFSDSVIIVYKVTSSSTGQLQKATINCRCSTGTCNNKIAVYEDSSGLPGSLLAVSDIITLSSNTYAYRDIDFSGSNKITINSGASYWIGGIGDTENFYYYSTDSYGYIKLNSDSYATGPRNPFGTSLIDSTGEFSLYLTAGDITQTSNSTLNNSSISGGSTIN